MTDTNGINITNLNVPSYESRLQREFNNYEEMRESLSSRMDNAKKVLRKDGELSYKYTRLIDFDDHATRFKNKLNALAILDSDSVADVQDSFKSMQKLEDKYREQLTNGKPVKARNTLNKIHILRADIREDAGFYKPRADQINPSNVIKRYYKKFDMLDEAIAQQKELLTKSPKPALKAHASAKITNLNKAKGFNKESIQFWKDLDGQIEKLGDMDSDKKNKINTKMKELLELEAKQMPLIINGQKSEMKSGWQEIVRVRAELNSLTQ